MENQTFPRRDAPSRDAAARARGEILEGPPRGPVAPLTWAYEDRALGDAGPLVVETADDVFRPTTTTRLLLRAVRRHAAEGVRSALDLGCGCGVVAAALRRHVVPEGTVAASDISPAAVELTRRNAANAGVEVDVRCGSLFEPWAGMRFDLIVDDVAAMAEPLARASPWYPPQIASDAGEDGTRWITSVLRQAPGHLERGGRIVFPVLSLADQALTLEAAREAFGEVRLLEEEWYPIAPELAARSDLLEELERRGTVELRRRGSRLLWATRVYVAEDPR
jgi:release factor glutamine methyltransferase